MKTDGPIVIIGAGEAGATLAADLARRGNSLPIHLVGAEDCAPYERPPLSKAHLEPDEIARVVPLFAGGDIPDAIIHHRGVHALRIDRAARTVELSDGQRLDYGRLVLATGAASRRLPIAEGIVGIHYLRNLREAQALRPLLLAGGPIAILGAGFIGLEVAAAARKHGTAVSVIEPQARILARGVSASIAGKVQELHERNGVAFRLGTSVSTIDRSGDTIALILSDGGTIAATTIVIGIGAVPEVALAREAGLMVDNGITVDARLQTSDPAILAIGDCCAFPLSIYGGRRVRLESWRNARDQAAMAAALLSGEAIGEMPLPWFWSDQYDHGLQVAGLIDEGGTEILRRPNEDVLMSFHLAADGRLVAAQGFGPGQAVARDIRLAEMLIGRGARPDPAFLADPSVKLKSLL
ncbi:FAD-dependent oxidoreductase [Rhizobium sp. RU36D]|uniref:NAD(P)/FAD-dependent oxidoreductase n=1 Tax=Rhizobium sp. RU36D TaxID=1907415 RepID=UPI000A05AC29|nr:FAD-dependent oxidoreductase [Rhizobium sp. RU36D]